MSTQAKRIDTMTPLPVVQDDKVVMCGSGGVHTSTLEQLMEAVKANIKVGGHGNVHPQVQVRQLDSVGYIHYNKSANLITRKEVAA